jgi:DnaJ domain
MTVEAYPLQWPAGKPRASHPEASRFDRSRSLAASLKGLLNEIRLLGGTLPVVSTNIKLRLDGIPYANQAQPRDKGVAVYFTLKEQPMCFSCDRWDRVEDNLYAIAMTIGALRGIERWGSGSMVEQAFTGFIALPAPKSPWDVLGVPRGASQDEIEAAYRQKAKTAHPDKGGTPEAMQDLNEARAALKGGAV